MNPKKSNDEDGQGERLEDKQKRFEDDMDYVQRRPGTERLSRPLDSQPLHRPRPESDLKK